MGAAIDLRHDMVKLNGAMFHVASAGAETGEPVILLHGFPECWYHWRRVMADLAPRHWLVAPDCRGYHLSEKTAEPADYTAAALCDDIRALLAWLDVSSCVLVGHDWGGVLAWEFAARFPQLVSRMVILNAPHPNRFQQALDRDPAQRAASQYITRLRDAGAAQRLADSDAAALWQIAFGELERRGLVDCADREVYLAGWRQPGAIDAMLNWYRAAPFVVPAPDAPFDLDRQQGSLARRIGCPTLLLWGMRDEVLLPALTQDLAGYVPHLQVVAVADAGHGIVHEQPALVAAAIARFIGQGAA